MRDAVVLLIVFVGVLAALRRPWIGVMLWTWISIMNPHRYAWSIAYSAPVAAAAAIATLIGALMTRDRGSPFKAAPMTWLALFVVWMTVSWLLGMDPSGDYEQWNKVMKILLMIFVGMALLRTQQHIFALAWVAAGSLALLGAKGGLFTMVTGGGERVWGPPGSFIQDNNEFALALVMTIPLLRFLQLQLRKGWRRHGMTLVMLLCGAAALGTHSRGALLAMVAMLALLWWRGRSRVLGGLVILLAGLALVSFMPESWTERMESIGTYDTDQSALGRFAAWEVAWRAALDHPFGVGFNASRPELFAAYLPGQNVGTPAAHSIYFQVLGHHGFVGLAIFVGLWVSTWRVASRVRRMVRELPQARWCSDLAAMCQVSLAGYAVGGAFLSLSYFDLPYNVMMLVVLTLAWVERRAWETEPVPVQGRWLRVPGLSPPQPAAAKGP